MKTASPRLSLARTCLCLLVLLGASPALRAQTTALWTYKVNLPSWAQHVHTQSWFDGAGGSLWLVTYDADGFVPAGLLNENGYTQVIWLARNGIALYNNTFTNIEWNTFRTEGIIQPVRVTTMEVAFEVPLSYFEYSPDVVVEDRALIRVKRVGNSSVAREIRFGQGVRVRAEPPRVDRLGFFTENSGALPLGNSSLEIRRYNNVFPY